MQIKQQADTFISTMPSSFPSNTEGLFIHLVNASSVWQLLVQCEARTCCLPPTVESTQQQWPVTVTVITASFTQSSRAEGSFRTCWDYTVKHQTFRNSPNVEVTLHQKSIFEAMIIYCVLLVMWRHIRQWSTPTFWLPNQSLLNSESEGWRICDV